MFAAPLRRARRAAGATIPLALALALTLACTEPGAPAADADEDAELAALRALPYVQWDEDADAGARGVTRFDRDLAWSGINVFTDDVNRAFAVDMEGEVVHRWQLPDRYRHCEHIEILDGGDSLFVCVGEGLVRVDPSSNVVWSRRLSVHHDVAIRADGSFLVPYLERARRHNGWRVKFDAIAHVGADGELLGRWSTYDLLPDLGRHQAARRIDRQRAESEAQDRPFEYYHLNSIEVLAETPLGLRDPRFKAGNLLLCLRNVSLIVVLDAESWKVVWHWGAGELDLPHMPTMLADGNILVFDNGASRGHSRVVEIEPASGQIVWQYPGDPSESFFSKWRGSNQRLPNGNTLICESERGRIFEVTPTGEVVWEFWNPQLRDGKRKRIYRAARIDPRLLSRSLSGR